MTNIRPLHDRVVVKRLAEEQKTSGGIIIPDNATEKPTQGTIVAVGNGTRDEAGNIRALDVKVGDIVLLNKWGGTEIKLNNEEYLILKESEILGIIEK